MSLNLKQWRLVKGFTQAEMAEKCGIHVNTYMAWEKYPENMSIRNAVLVSEVLEEPIDAIFSEINSTNCR